MFSVRQLGGLPHDLCKNDRTRLLCTYRLSELDEKVGFIIFLRYCSFSPWYKISLNYESNESSPMSILLLIDIYKAPVEGISSNVFNFYFISFYQLFHNL